MSKQSFIISNRECVTSLGGGIAPNRLSDILSFGYSTVSESQEKLVDQNINGWIRSDMAGYGM